MDSDYSLNPPHYATVARKILWTFVIVSFLPLLIMTGSVLYQSHIFYHEKVKNQLEYLAKIHTQNIDTFLAERLNDIRLIAAGISFENLKDEAFLAQLLKTLRQDHGQAFSDLGIVDETGKQVAYTGPFHLEKADYSQAEWFKAAIENEFYVSDVFLGLRGLPHFIVTVKKVWQGRSWIIRATIDFRSFNAVVGNLRIGKTGFAFILNRDGEFQTKTLSDVEVGRSNYIKLFADELVHEGNRIRFVERGDVTGINTIYVTAPLKDGSWMMVVQQISKDAFRDLRKTQTIAFINLIIGSITIIAAGIVLSRFVSKRLLRVNQEKELMNQQIIESGKLASLGELAAGIAHEINNPVAIMVEEAGWIGDLLEDEEFEESENMDEFRRALKQINTQGIRCRDITQKLLSFARKCETTFAVVQVNELINEVVGISGQHAKYNNVLIETRFAEDLPFIEISQTEVQQVMLNLINNALDAMEKTGGVIRISTELNEDRILISVSDDGPGIPETLINRVFDPFYTTKPVGKGTGLGLSICYGLVSRMGGKIKVESTVGVGTTFKIYLPVGETRKSVSGDALPEQTACGA